MAKPVSFSFSGRVPKYDTTECARPLNQYRQECHDLLEAHKNTVEGLLALPSNNVWNTYGGLDRLQKCVDNILRHRLKNVQSQDQSHRSAQNPVPVYSCAGTTDYWLFVRGLRRLNPMMAPAIDRLDRIAPNSAGQRWLMETLTNHDLSSQLLLLVNCRQHLLQHYHTEAFLCQPDYFHAMWLCLQAVEQNNPSLLADVNPIKLNLSTTTSNRVSHNRSSSLPLITPLPILQPSEHTSIVAQSPPTSEHLRSGHSSSDRLVNCDTDRHRVMRLYDSTDSAEATLSVSPNDYCAVNGTQRINDPLMNFYTTSSEHAGIESQRHRAVASNHWDVSVSSENLEDDDDHTSPSLSSISTSMSAQNHPPSTNLKKSSQVMTSRALLRIKNDAASTADKARVHVLNLDNKTRTASGSLDSVLDRSTAETTNQDASIYGTVVEKSSSCRHLPFAGIDDASSWTVVDRVPPHLGGATLVSYSLDAILNCEEDGIDVEGQSIVADSGIHSVTTRSSSIKSAHSYTQSVKDGPGSGKLKTPACTSITADSVRSFESGVSVNTTVSAVTNTSDNVPLTTTAAGSRFSKTASIHTRSMSDFGVSSLALPPRDNGALSPESKHSRTVAWAPDSREQFLSTSLPVRSSGIYSRRAVGRPSGGFFRQPQEGQSLMSFLSSQDFHTCTDVDRENAHFSIAETLIAAIEQMKWNQMICPKRGSTGDDEHEEWESDEEIEQLKQRIRIRRTERMTEKAKQFPGFFESEVGIDAAAASTDSAQSDTIASFETLSQGSHSSSSDNVHDADISDADSKLGVSNLARLNKSGLSLSMASLYSDVELSRRNAAAAALDSSTSSVSPPVVESLVTSSSSHASADSIAIALLKRFAANQLPKASELVWLVSEQDAPQKLLPLPESYPISPDDGENADLQLGKQNRLRGTLDWAPPRAQIISSIHPKLKQKEVLSKQNNRCAGCGSKVEQGYLKRYQYCEYLGKYFCPCCHIKDRAYIPGRILRKWDFYKYPVSRFAFDLLRRIYSDPLFSVESSTIGLYRRVKALDQIRECRIQLYYLNAFIRTCTQYDRLRPLSMLDDSPSHWFSHLNTVHIYSLSELVQVKKQELLPIMKEIVATCIGHISKCILCQAKGSICEICRNGHDIIYPFELIKVSKCEGCGACFHKTCFDAKPCPRCTRIRARKQQTLLKAIEEPNLSSEEC